jgi:hypothetical protein
MLLKPASCLFVPNGRLKIFTIFWSALKHLEPDPTRENETNEYRISRNFLLLFCLGDLCLTA